jgi:tetratricopeptide (TPR) repeat protein
MLPVVTATSKDDADAQLTDLPGNGPRLFDRLRRDDVIARLARLTPEGIANDAGLSYLAGMTATLNADQTSAIRHLLRAQALAVSGEPALRARIAFELGYLYLSRSEHAAADATLLRARDQDAPETSADVDHLRALIADAAGNYREARDAYRSAIGRSSSALTRATGVLALTNLAVSLNHRDPRESVSLCGLALATLDAEELHPQIRPSVRNVMGYALTCTGDLDLAREALEGAREDARQLKQGRIELYATFNLAIVDELEGQSAAAISSLEDISARARQAELRAFDGWAVIRRAWLRSRDGDLDASHRLVSERFGPHVPAAHASALRMLSAVDDVRANNYGRARSALLELVRSYGENDDQLDRFVALLWLATLYRNSGRDALARRSCGEAAALGQAHGFRIGTNFWDAELVATARACTPREHSDFVATLIAGGATIRQRRYANVVISADGTIAIDGTPLADDAWRQGRTGRRQLRRLFEALHAAYPSAIERGQLADLLWPDSDGDRATANLYAAINDLRHVLGAVPGVTLVLREGAYALQLGDTARLSRAGSKNRVS